MQVLTNALLRVAAKLEFPQMPYFVEDLTWNFTNSLLLIGFKLEVLTNVLLRKYVKL